MIIYEWCIEELEGGEVAEVHLADTLRELLVGEVPEGALCLVVRLECGAKGWAYLTQEGTLEPWLRDAGACRLRRVPQRFHAELRRAVVPAVLAVVPHWEQLREALG